MARRGGGPAVGGGRVVDCGVGEARCWTTAEEGGEEEWEEDGEEDERELEKGEVE